jgi:hypothetical protein
VIRNTVDDPSAFSKAFGEQENGTGQAEIDAAANSPCNPRTVSEVILSVFTIEMQGITSIAIVYYHEWL